MINGFEGGVVITDDGALADTIARMRNFGFVGYDEVGGPGINAKLSEAHAAAALVNLRYVESLKETGHRHMVQYGDALAGVPGLKPYRTGYTSNGSYVVVEVRDGAGLTRDQLMEALWAEGIKARRYFAPGCHKQAPYNAQTWDLPRTEQAARTTLVLPTGSALTPGDVSAVCDVISFIMRHAEDVAERLEAGS
jgi:dTDP-4-amino-4,6-dideoxyglucose